MLVDRLAEMAFHVKSQATAHTKTDLLRRFAVLPPPVCSWHDIMFMLDEFLWGRQVILFCFALNSCKQNLSTASLPATKSIFVGSL